MLWSFLGITSSICRMGVPVTGKWLCMMASLSFENGVVLVVVLLKYWLMTCSREVFFWLCSGQLWSVDAEINIKTSYGNLLCILRRNDIVAIILDINYNRWDLSIFTARYFSGRLFFQSIPASFTGTKKSKYHCRLSLIMRFHYVCCFKKYLAAE